MHKLCQESAAKLLAEFKPQLMIAIGGGGYVPARILRSFLKQPDSPNIPIQAIGLSLYESLGDEHVELQGTTVTRTQWLDLTALGEMKDLVGKRVLIVDEVDDTRTTLEYAVKELQKDVEAARQQMGGDQPKTQFGIFVLHVSHAHVPRPSSSSSLPLPLLRAKKSVAPVEQGQEEEGQPARRHNGWSLLGRSHCRRCVDMLSLGGHRH